MAILQSLLYALLVGLVAAALIQAQDQSGFISIDCGLAPGSSYSEQTTGINYISDARFINSGVPQIVAPEVRGTYQQQLWSLRSFPQGMRNCYRINITSGSKYLIRASFLYGNYDGQNVLPQFDLLLGPNKWDTVTIKNASVNQNFELIHVPTLNYMQTCVANTGQGTPFISSIELRPLSNDTYITQFGSLSLYLRLDLGSTSNRSYRYPYDALDRFWDPNVVNRDWRQITGSIPANTLAQNHYEPPEIVMSTASRPVNVSAPMTLLWEPASATDLFYVYMHFSEIQVLNGNQTRSFNITQNGKLFYPNLVPKYLTTTTVYSQSAVSGQSIEFLLVRTEQSTLPPMINAIEIYAVKDFSQSETDQEDVDAITSIKSTYGVTRNWQGDPCSPLAYSWDGLNCTYEGSNPPRITSLYVVVISSSENRDLTFDTTGNGDLSFDTILTFDTTGNRDLSSSGLTGNIDVSISRLTMLQNLDLSNNSLNGQVPDFLSQLQSLSVLNLANNNLTGPIPSELLQKSNSGTLSLRVGQNPYLCESTPCNNNNNNNNKKKSNVVVPVVASVGGVLIFLIVVGAVFWTLKKKQPKPDTLGAAPSEISSLQSQHQNYSALRFKKRQYSYLDILKITNNFDRILGKGGFGTVYLGLIDETHVAVKMLSSSSAQGYQQFQAEVKLLLRVHHRNLTSLIGYCNEEANKGLIYEYMGNGNLQEHISGHGSKAKFLTWEDRLHIALDAAQGLEYLHNGCKPPIIHRDVKSTNILLTENFEAKLSDFGLSKVIPTDDESHVSTVVAGTPGYLDPEYYTTNRLTEKSDIYSFGVVILEIITSQPVISRNHEMAHLSQRVNSMVAKGDIKNVVDPRLHGEFDTNSVWKAVEIGMACVYPNPSARPNMSEVVAELRECLATEVVRTKHSGISVNTGDSLELVASLSTETSPFAR